MGIGDSIRKAADDAMKDLGNNAPPADDGHTPAPGNNDGDVQVNSSISEGSNAMDRDRSDQGTDGSDDAPPETLWPETLPKRWILTRICRNPERRWEGPPAAGRAPERARNPVS